MEMKEYKKYRWFYTSSGKLVLGGKNAEQNEILLKKLKSLPQDRIVMHTAQPGSPFSIILEEIDKIKEKDLMECAIFTASFSRAWKEGKKEAIVDFFKLSQLYKSKIMKTGTWGVRKKIERMTVPLKLALTKQDNMIRAVPEITVKSREEKLLTILPGKKEKTKIIPEIRRSIKIPLSEEELLAALPAGGISIKK